MNVALIWKLRGAINAFILFFDMLSMGDVYNQALADVRSTGAGMNYLYCRLCEGVEDVQ